MAADVGQRFSGWSCSDLPYKDHNPQDYSVQQMVLNHGSVSFGRFAAESLSWEKRSVFDHNRRQEELRKLTAPGLVAQKKAFFEEYYKRARHLKAQGAMQRTEAAMERNDESTLGHSTQADAVMLEDPVANAPSSSSEPSTEANSSGERKCQELGYLTFNPLFSQTAVLQNIEEEERPSSGQTQNLDQEFPCTPHASGNHEFSRETIERKVLAPRHVVSNDNGESNVSGSRIVLPVASLQSEGLEVGHEKRGVRKTVAVVNRSTKISKDLQTSVIHTRRVDLRRNSENRPSQDLKDPFYKRVEMQLRALSDRLDADKTAASSRSAAYKPPDRALTSCRSSYQNANRLTTSSRSSMCQNTDRVLASSKLTAQASLRYRKGVQRSDALSKGSSPSHVVSTNSTVTGKLAAKTLVMPSSSQVSSRTSRTVQATSKRSAAPTSINNGSQNKRKQLSTPAALDENNRKRGYVRASAPPSARSSSENIPPTAKAPKISNVRNVVTKTELVQKSRSASHPVGASYTATKRFVSNEQNRKARSASHPVGASYTATKRSVSNEQNRMVPPSVAGRLAESGMRSNLKRGPPLTKKKTRQERPQWR